MKSVRIMFDEDLPGLNGPWLDITRQVDRLPRQLVWRVRNQIQDRVDFGVSLQIQEHLYEVR